MTILLSNKAVSLFVLVQLCMLAVLPETADARRGGFLSALLGAGRAVDAAASAARRTTKSYGSNMLSPTQLEGCVLRAQALDDNKYALELDASSLTSESKTLEVIQSKMDVERTQLHRASPAAVDQFNARINAFNKRLDEYRSNVSAYRADEHNLNYEVRSYNLNCAKAYYVDDMEAIKAKLGLGSSTPTSEGSAAR